MFHAKAILKRFGYIASFSKCRALCGGERTKTPSRIRGVSRPTGREASRDTVLQRTLGDTEERETEYFAGEGERAARKTDLVKGKEHVGTRNTG